MGRWEREEIMEIIKTLEFYIISLTLSFHDLSQLPRVYFLKAGNNGDMNELGLFEIARSPPGKKGNKCIK